MATRGIIAVARAGDGCWRGRYAHWDNYPERIVPVAREAWTGRPVPERQPAIAAVAALATPAADALLEEWAAALDSAV